MKIHIYSQHVLGAGHFVRSLRLVNALEGHAVTLISGGPEVPLAVPGFAKVRELPPLVMDADFGGLKPLDANLDLEQVKARRMEKLQQIFTRDKPDLFLVELFPFGRKAFRFELIPLLEKIRAKEFGDVKTVVSVRDILVEKPDRDKHEARAARLVNDFFDLVLVHADPDVVRFEETFGRFADLKPPVRYTGYVCNRPAPGLRESARASLGLAPDDCQVVASAGGGSVGFDLLAGAVQTFHRLGGDWNMRLTVLTGPFMSEDSCLKLEDLAENDDRIEVSRFDPDFTALLAASDLSVSMAGYNTTMDVVASGMPALVLPFAQNREQAMRAQRLAGRGLLKVLEQKDLEPKRLAPMMANALKAARPKGGQAINLNGAANTRAMLEALCAGRPV